MDVALATCAQLPEPDPDAAPLLAALDARGIEAAALAWDDPAVDWSVPRLVVLRSTWNYPQRVADFGAWIGAVAGRSTLLNPASVVRWNLHKGYLLALSEAGVPTTPTEVVRAGGSLRRVLEARGWSDVVVKPAISASSYRTRRIRSFEVDEGEVHLGLVTADGDALVQPYVASVEGHGERALVWIDGEVTHAVRKSVRWDGEDESVSQESVPVSAAERVLAAQAVAVAATRGPLLYARVDVANDAHGAPMVMELELIEPSLFFAQGAPGLARYVDAVARTLDSLRPR